MNVLNVTEKIWVAVSYVIQASISGDFLDFCWSILVMFISIQMSQLDPRSYLC